MAASEKKKICEILFEFPRWILQGLHAIESVFANNETCLGQNQGKCKVDLMVLRQYEVHIEAVVQRCSVKRVF